MKDGLILVDIQKDFCPGGALAVPQGDEIIPCCNALIASATQGKVPLFISRDWHPVDHCSFVEQGGMWPPHCVAHSDGAAFHDDLTLPDDALVFSKATEGEKDAYSAFQGTSLLSELRRRGITRLFVAGLATDYCVLATVLDGLVSKLDIHVVRDGCRGVDVTVGDSDRALQRMSDAGAKLVTLDEALEMLGQGS